MPDQPPGWAPAAPTTVLLTALGVLMVGQMYTVLALLHPMADSFDPVLDFQFTACSGAKTFQMAQSNLQRLGLDGNFHEKSQIDSGALSEDTTPGHADQGW